MSSEPRPALASVRAQLRAATAATKCHSCGCLQKTVNALESTEAGALELRDVLVAARSVFTPRKYDCLGCEVCFPAIAANAFSEAFPEVSDELDLCPTDNPDASAGWPPLPGDYRVLRYAASVAVCTLNDEALAARLATLAPEGLAVVGTLRTENLGIERIIKNILANPNIRSLILCGADTKRAVGHLPGQSLESLFAHGCDEHGRILGAHGKRPVLKNVRPEQVAAFLRQVTLTSLIGEVREELILRAVADCATCLREPFVGASYETTVTTVTAVEPERLVSDPAGFLVVYPDRASQTLVVEHYTNSGTLDCVVVGTTATAMYSELIARQLISRLDHAAYLGRELARAERSLKSEEPYVQDRAPGRQAPVVESPRPGACGCGTSCATESSLNGEAQ